MKPEYFAEHVLKWLGAKTMAQFREEAGKTLNGTLYSAIRDETGQRFILLVCMTGQHEIAKAEKVFNFTGEGVPVEWESELLRDTVMKLILGGGFSYEDERDPLTGRRKALMLLSSEPKSMDILERLLDLK